MVSRNVKYNWEENTQPLIHEVVVFMLSLTCLGIILFFSFLEEDHIDFLTVLIFLFVVMVYFLLELFSWSI